MENQNLNYHVGNSCWNEILKQNEFDTAIKDIPRIFEDAKRWRWLRQQKGWPDTEVEVSGYTPEQFDELADKNMSPPQEARWKV